MEFVQKHRLLIAAALVVILGIVLVMGWDALRPLPDNTEFKSREYSFTYPRIYDAKEYAPGVVSLGHKTDDGFDPLVEINRYQSDPDVAAPKSFDVFMKLQAAALCGADGPVESISCKEVGVTAYTSPIGLAGQMLNLTMVHKNLKTGTTSNSTYGPIYVFNTTSTASTTPENPLRYSAIFIYPSLPAFLNGTTSPALMQQVLSTFTIASST